MVFDPLPLIVNAAERSHGSPLRVSTTLQLYDESGLPVDYISGDILHQAMLQAYRRVFSPIHAERLAAFDAIPDWTLSPELLDVLVPAIVDPFFAGLTGPDARLQHLCCEMMIRDELPLPEDLWWTPIMIERLRAANPDPLSHDRFPAGMIAAETNFALLHFCKQGLLRRDLPLSEDHPSKPAYGFRRSLRAMVRGVLNLYVTWTAADDDRPRTAD